MRQAKITNVMWFNITLSSTLLGIWSFSRKGLILQYHDWVDQAWSWIKYHDWVDLVRSWVNRKLKMSIAITIAVEIIGIILPLLLRVVFLVLIEHKVMTFVQCRKGPNVVGSYWTHCNMIETNMTQSVHISSNWYFELC